MPALLTKCFTSSLCHIQIIYLVKVMMERYNRGDKKGMVEVYKELNKKARKIVVQKILDSRHLNEWSVISDIIMRLMFD
jgi:hypothetical protein